MSPVMLCSFVCLKCCFYWRKGWLTCIRQLVLPSTSCKGNRNICISGAIPLNDILSDLLLSMLRRVAMTVDDGDDIFVHMLELHQKIPELS